MLVLGRVAKDRDEGLRQAHGAINSGAGLERLRRIIEQQHGDPKIVDDYSRLPSASARHVVVAPRDGFLNRLDAELVGRASVMLGAGRDRVEDAVDLGVGIVVLAKPGDELRGGDPVLELHYNDRGRLAEANALVTEAIDIGETCPEPRSLIVDEVR
jgi:thymidine phosphorylase